MGILKGVEMKFPIKIVDEFIQEVKISDVPSEKPSEIVIEIAWVTALYYALGTTLLMQVQLILDGVRGHLDYPITSSEFWTDYIFLSFMWLIIGAIGGFIVGLIHGGLISVIYHKRSEISAQPLSFKFIVYAINLLIPILIIVALFYETITRRVGASTEDFGLITMAFAAAAFYTSRRFWRWWTKDSDIVATK